MRQFLFWITLFAIGWAGDHCIATQNSSEAAHEEVVAGYEQNALGIGVFRVNVHMTSSATAEHVDVLKARLLRLQTAVGSIGLESKSQFEHAISDIEREILSSESLPVRYESASIIIGVDSLHVIRPQLDLVGGEIAPRLHTKDDLVNHYSSHKVLVWSSTQQPNTWVWHGHDNRDGSDLFTASLTSKQPRDKMLFPVPPLGMRIVGIREDQYSLLDRPFRIKHDDARVVGREEIEGVPTLTIEGRTPGHNGKRTCDFTRAWIDINRGYIPVRVERMLTSLAIDKGDWIYSEPFEILQVSEIRKVNAHCYYPVSWTVEKRQDDDRVTVPRPIATNQRVPTYTYQTEKWVVDSVATNIDEPALLSEIGFPKGTHCFDETKNQFFIVGDVEAVVDATIQSVPKVVQSPPGTLPTSPPEALQGGWTGWRWFLLANVLVIVGLAVFAAVRVFRVARRKGGSK